MTDVLLVIADNYQTFNQFPLGPAYIGAVLEQHGYSVEVYCMDVFHYTNMELTQKLQENEYELIGLDFMAARFKETILDLCKVINKYKKKAKFILGGHGPTPIPIYTLQKTKADIVAIGEAEETVIDVMKAIRGEIPFKSVKSIGYREGNHIYVSSRRKPPNINKLPFPAWHLFPIDKYSESTRTGWMEEGEKYLAMITSRGCINACTFCAKIEKGIRLRNLNSVVEEIRLLRDRYGITCFCIADELFLISKKRTMQFLNLLKENDLKIKFSINARADIIDEELAIALKKGGCNLVSVGFESSSQDTLNCMKKNVTVEDNLRTLEISKKVGLPVALNFIWGYPTDTYETLKENARLIKKYNQYMQLRTIRYVTPYPGCELYYDAIMKGLIGGPDDFFSKFRNSDLMTINFTKYSVDACNKWMLEVNSDLIIDHYKNTNGDMKEAEYFIQQYKELLDGKNDKFRGFRRYEAK